MKGNNILNSATSLPFGPLYPHRSTKYINYCQARESALRLTKSSSCIQEEGGRGSNSKITAIGHLQSIHSLNTFQTFSCHCHFRILLCCRQEPPPMALHGIFLEPRSKHKAPSRQGAKPFWGSLWPKGKIPTSPASAEVSVTSPPPPIPLYHLDPLMTPWCLVSAQAAVSAWSPHVTLWPRTPQQPSYSLQAHLSIASPGKPSLLPTPPTEGTHLPSYIPPGHSVHIRR